MGFFTENLGTIIVGAAVALIIVLIILRLLKKKRAGGTSCGCECSGCPGAGLCQDDTGNKE